MNIYKISFSIKMIRQGEEWEELKYVLTDGNIPEAISMLTGDDENRVVTAVRSVEFLASDDFETFGFTNLITK